MEVLWPQPFSPTDQTRAALEDKLTLMSAEGDELTISEYACLVLRNDIPYFIGKLLLVQSAHGEPLALARKAMGYITWALGTQAARRFLDQVEWARGRAAEMDVPGIFRPAYLLSPAEGVSELALSLGPYRNVQYVVQGENTPDRARRLEGLEDFVRYIQTIQVERGRRTQEALTRRPEAFQGLPS